MIWRVLKTVQSKALSRKVFLSVKVKEEMKGLKFRERLKGLLKGGLKDESLVHCGTDDT